MPTSRNCNSSSTAIAALLLTASWTHAAGAPDADAAALASLNRFFPSGVSLASSSMASARSPPPPPPPAPPPPGPFRTVNERVLVQDLDGWLLMAAYNHQANTNPSLVEGTAPSSATEGFSHVWPGTHLGLTASDIAEVRFYCHTSHHDRVMHFSMHNDWVKTAILTGSISGNLVSYWTSGTTKLDGHTAYLPDATVYGYPNHHSGHHYPATFFDFPFYDGRSATTNWHWAVKGKGGNFWCCDDSVGGDFDTLHQIWIKLEE
mmetsp:Transcript_9712/g.39776  ORF Transcript_9712/g.39776 Transcript_9712/m.39776 type:complete len:262 (-) Transcript_9712:153-938(-)